MIAAYFDETGIHDQSPFAAVCGLVGSTIEWARLELPWRKILARHGVTHFHSSAMPTKEIRDSLAYALVDEIAKRDFDVVIAAVAKQDWDRCVSPDNKQRFQTPYHFCFEFMLHKLNTLSIERARREPIAAVFADHPSYRLRAEQIHAEYHHSSNYPNVGSLTFGSPRDVIPLQAADLLAHEAFQHMRNRIERQASETELTPVLRRFVAMMSDPSNAGFYDCDNLVGLKPTGGFV
jgi:hypothetical protein